MPEFTPEQDARIAEFESQPANTNVGFVPDLLGNVARGVGTGLMLPIQQLNTLAGDKNEAARTLAVREALARSEAGDLLPTNPNLAQSLPSIYGRSVGQTIPMAALFAANAPLAVGVQTLSTQQGLDDADAQRQAMIDAGETPPEKQNAIWEHAKGLATLYGFSKAAQLAQPVLRPLIASTPSLLRPAVGVAGHTLSNFGIDAAIRTGEHALAGQPLAPFASKEEAAEAAGAATAFAFPGGIHQAVAQTRLINKIQPAIAKGQVIPAEWIKQSGLRTPEGYTKDGDYFRPQTPEEKLAKATSLLPNATRTAEELSETSQQPQATEAAQAAQANIAEETLKPPQAVAEPAPYTGPGSLEFRRNEAIDAFNPARDPEAAAPIAAVQLRENLLRQQQIAEQRAAIERQQQLENPAPVEPVAEPVAEVPPVTLPESQLALATSPKSYDEAQKRVDDIETKLEGEGVDVTKLYDPTTKGNETLAEIGWKPMPPDLVAAYKARDAIGEGQLKESIGAIKGNLEKAGLTHPDEIASVLESYHLDEGNTGGVAQYMASEYAQRKLSRPLQQQVEEIALKLAIRRSKQGGADIDEVRDVPRNTMVDAAKAVKAMFDYFGVKPEDSELGLRDKAGRSETPRTKQVAVEQRAETRPTESQQRLTSEQRIADIDKEMDALVEKHGFNEDTGELNDTNPTDKKRYDAISKERVALFNGDESSLGAPPTTTERVPGLPGELAETPQRGAGVPGDEAVVGERGEAAIPEVAPEVERPQGERFGVSRRTQPNASLALLPDEKFQAQRKKAAKELDRIEKTLDDKGFDGLTSMEKRVLGERQDIYAQHELENLRRASKDRAPEDLFDELLDRVDRLGGDPAKERGTEAYEEARILADELRRQKATQDQMGRNQLDSMLRGSASDKAEVLQARMNELRKFLTDAYGEPTDVPRLDEPNPTPRLKPNEEAQQEQPASDNAGAREQGERGAGPRPDEGVASGEQPQSPRPEGEGAGVQPRAESGLSAKEAKELADNEAEQDAIFKQRKQSKKDEARVEELQTRRDELLSKRGPNTIDGPALPRVKLDDLVAPDVSRENLEKSNKHVAEVLVPRAQKVMEAIAGEPIKVVVVSRNNRGFGVGLTGDGKLELHVDPDAGAVIRSFGKTDGKTSAYARKNLGEEIIHLAQLVGLRNLWLKADPLTRGNAEEFAITHVKDIASGMREWVAELRSKGENERADRIESAIEGSNNLYNLSKGKADGASLLEAWEQNPIQAYKRLLELGRQFEQEARDGTITETFVNRVLSPLGNWIRESYRALRGGLGLAKEGGFGPEFDQLFKDTQRNLLGHDITLKEALPKSTIDALDSLGLRWDGAMGGFGKRKPFNLFTPTDLPAKESTTFAAPLGVTVEQLRERRKNALLPFNERPNNSGRGQDTSSVPDTGPTEPSGSLVRETEGEPAPVSNAIRADAQGVRPIEPMGTQIEGPGFQAALDKIKEVVGGTKYGRVAEHRADKMVKDIRSHVESLYANKEAKRTDSAIANRTSIEIALKHNKEDYDPASLLREAGGGRLRDKENPSTPEEVRAFLENEKAKGIEALDNPDVPEKAKETIREFLPKYDRALTIKPEMVDAAEKSGQLYDESYDMAEAAGAKFGYRQDYLSRAWEENLTRGGNPEPPESILSGGGGKQFAKTRKYETLMDGIIGHKNKAGTWDHEVPKSISLPDLIANRTDQTVDMVVTKLIEDQLQTTLYPGKTQPILTPAPTDGTPPPQDYVKISGPAGRSIYAYRPIADLFKSILSPSAITQSNIGQVAVTGAGVLKHGSLVFDSFHTSRAEQKSLADAATHGPAKAAEWLRNHPSYTEQGKMGKYLAQYDLRPDDAKKALDMGLINQEGYDYMQGRGKEVQRRGHDGGLLAGRFMDNLWNEANGFMRSVAKLGNNISPKVGKSLESGIDFLEKFNKFTFDRLTRAAMIMSFDNRLERIDRDFPELSESQRNRKAAKETNEFYGNIGRGGVLKSRTAQHIGQLLTLAPGWWQSQIMTEARQYAQLGRAAYEAGIGRKLPNGERERVFRLGNNARLLAQTALTVFAANQVINMATRGHPTWQNPEDDHKFDAWIPGGKTGFFYSPIALVSEYAHQLHNYTKFESVPSAISHIASNKLSPMASAAKVALTQKDYTGKKLSPGETAVATARQLVPIPIIASSAAKGASDSSKKGTLQQNLLRSAGISTDRAPDAVGIAYDAFKKYRTKEKPDTGPSPYRDLKTLVQNQASPEKIKAEVDRLKKDGKSEAGIKQSFNAQFHPSGSLSGDTKALEKEGKRLQDILSAARKQKQAEREYFMKALQSK